MDKEKHLYEVLIVRYATPIPDGLEKDAPHLYEKMLAKRDNIIYGPIWVEGTGPPDAAMTMLLSICSSIPVQTRSVDGHAMVRHADDAVSGTGRYSVHGEMVDGQAIYTIGPKEEVKSEL